MKIANIIKASLCLAILGFFILPFLQNEFTFYNERALNGSYGKTEKLNFSWRAWNSGSYQRVKERTITENFGFRSTMVRLYNELRFRLFHKSSVGEMVIGKENFLFSQYNIAAYTGADYAGTAELMRKATSIKKIQDRLTEKGKCFLPIICPSKARFYREYLPENYSLGDSTNYEVLVKLFDKLKINYIDFQKLFLNVKDTSRYMLFPKYGVHWSSYGHSVAADSLLNYLRESYSNAIPITHWKKSIHLSKVLREYDYDAGESLNLLTEQLATSPMAYARFEFEKATKPVPRLLVVGDSFNFGLEITDYQSKAFSDYLFLYFFKIAVPEAKHPAFQDLKLKDEIENHDVFILSTTEQSLANYGWGFIEKVNNVLDGIDDEVNSEAERKILKIASNIKANDVYMEALREKAAESNCIVDALIQIEASAEYFSRQHHKDNEAFQKMLTEISKNQKWLKDVIMRADRKKISIDSALVLEALWQMR